MKITIDRSSTGEAPCYRGELRHGEVLTWQGWWRTNKETARADADRELGHRRLGAIRRKVRGK